MAKVISTCAVCGGLIQVTPQERIRAVTCQPTEKKGLPSFNLCSECKHLRVVLNHHPNLILGGSNVEYERTMEEKADSSSESP